MTDSQTRSELQNMIHAQALQFGQFTLASGQTSTYYIDGKEVTLRGRGLYLLASMILDYLDDAVEAVGGMSIGADPITGAVIALAAAQGRSLTGFLVRKQRKERGTTKLVEGPLSPGMKVAMLEDTMTTGGSTLSAIDSLLEEYEVEVVQVLTMVDRLQGGRENLAAAGHTLTSLFEITEFGIAIE